MPLHVKKKIRLLLFSVVLLHAALGQDRPSKWMHKVGAGGGIGITQYFSGFAFGGGYEAHLKNYFAAASINTVVEFQLFPQKLQTATDLSVMLNRSFTLEPVSFTAGAGLATTYHFLRVANLYNPEPGTYVDYDWFLKKAVIGFPVDLQLLVNIPMQRAKLPYMSVGVGSHSNFNKLNTMHCFYFKIGIAFK